MKKSRSTESQIINILKEAEAGVPVAEVCRKHGMSGCTNICLRALPMPEKQQHNAYGDITTNTLTWL